MGIVKNIAINHLGVHGNPPHTGYCPKGQQAERCQSGLLGPVHTRVNVLDVPWVRIPPSPLIFFVFFLLFRKNQPNIIVVKNIHLGM